MFPTLDITVASVIKPQHNTPWSDTFKHTTFNVHVVLTFYLFFIIFFSLHSTSCRDFFSFGKILYTNIFYRKYGIWVWYLYFEIDVYIYDLHLFLEYKLGLCNIRPGTIENVAVENVVIWTIAIKMSITLILYQAPINNVGNDKFIIEENYYWTHYSKHVSTSNMIFPTEYFSPSDSLKTLSFFRISPIDVFPLPSSISFCGIFSSWLSVPECGSNISA